MSTQETSTAATTTGGPPEEGFARVVCGVDGRRLGFEAVRQAARLTSSAGRLTLVGVVELFAALSEQWGPEPARSRLQASQKRSTEQCVADLTERVRASLGWAEAQASGPAELLSRVVRGEVFEGLLDATRDEGADLVAVGAHGGRRLVAAALADAAAIVLHDAPCSVLVARHGFDPGRFPYRVVVGVDGSPESLAALAAAAGIRRRAGGTLTVVTAGHDQEAAIAALDGFEAPHEHVAVPDRPVDALVTAALTADLTVVGSRGLHGRHALGSVSERVAFRADSSVLVVRPGEA
jgi:nucleotide-binding universal stress UspA family protein